MMTSVRKYKRNNIERERCLMMKKLISIVMIMFLLIGVMASNVSAAGSCTVSVGANKTSIKKGDTVTVTISFSVPVGAVTPVYLNYNSSVLKYKSTTNAVNVINNGNSIQLDYIDSFNAKTIRSMTVTFEAIATGTSNCSVSGMVLYGADGAKLTASAGSSKTITVIGNTSTKPNTNNTKPNTNTTTNNTSKDPTFTSVNQTVYAKSEVRVRASWSTSSRILSTLKKGDSIRRTGYSNNGWSRVVYNGQTAYVYSANITTTKPKDDDENNNDEKNNTTNEVSNEVKNNTVKNEATNNEINNEIDNNELNNNEVGNVSGNNEIKIDNEEKPDYIFYIIIIIIIIAIIIIIISTIHEGRRNSKDKRK